MIGPDPARLLNLPPETPLPDAARHCQNLLQTCRRQLDNLPDTLPDRPALQARIAALESVLGDFLAESRQRLAAAQNALATLPPKSPVVPKHKKDRENFTALVAELKPMLLEPPVFKLCEQAEVALLESPPQTPKARKLLREAREAGRELDEKSAAMLLVQKLETKLDAALPTPLPPQPPPPPAPDPPLPAASAAAQEDLPLEQPNPRPQPGAAPSPAAPQPGPALEPRSQAVPHQPAPRKSSSAKILVGTLAAVALLLLILPLAKKEPPEPAPQPQIPAAAANAPAVNQQPASAPTTPKPAPAETARSVTERPIPAPAPAKPAYPRLDAAFTNSLGMRFVPVPGAKALFSIWDTRVQDYQIFVEATAREWPAPNFTQGPKHPAVEVSWNDAHAFCQWLTTKEQKSGKISPDRAYRLPTAAEWSTAAGNTKYPWGDLFPPPKAAANLDQSLGVDEYRNTSPVGEFRPNPFGLHDMAGNVKQWCEDEPLLDPAHNSRVLRGSSWDTFRTLPLTTGFHSRNLQTARTGDTGFRCVLGPAPNPP